MGFLGSILPSLIGAGASIAGGLLGQSQQQPNQQLIQTQNQLDQLRIQMLQQYSPMFAAALRVVDPLLQQRMNLGSPYYQQQQRQTFEQGARDYQQQAGALNQQLATRGQGFAPSGLGTAAMGEMAMGSAQNLAQGYLQNLFQNQNTQMQAINAKLGEAGLLSPTNFLGQVPRTTFPAQNNPLGQGIAQAGSALAGLIQNQNQQGNQQGQNTNQNTIPLPGVGQLPPFNPSGAPSVFNQPGIIQNFAPSPTFGTPADWGG